MEILQNYYGWILLVLTIIAIFLIKRFTNNPDAITSKYIAEKTIQGPTSEVVKNIGKALKMPVLDR